MHDNFQIVKDALDIVEVAEYYGISVNRHNKAHCPWHDDRHPSLSFKKQRFKCFSCDEGGDVIDLARLLTNAATPLEAVRELNGIFGLGLDLDAPAPTKVIYLRELMQERRRQFDLWEKNASMILTAYFRFLWECRKYRAPKHPGEELDDLFVESLTKLDYIEYILDEIFMKGSREAKLEFLMSHAGMIREIEQRLIWGRIPYAHRDEAFYRQFMPFTPVVADGAAQIRKAA